MSERRRAERVEANLNAYWEGVLTQREGTIVDISATGCFILTADQVKPKELIRIEIQLPTGRWIYLWGEVVYQIHEMGFAIRFTGSSETEQKMLEMLIEYARGKGGEQRTNPDDRREGAATESPSASLA